MSTNTQSSEAINARLKLEAEIADFLRQRIEDGNLNAEDIPVRLARYGLMDPEAFADEMRERMGMADDEAAQDQGFIPSTKPADGGKNGMQIAVACVNASGIADLPIFTVEVTQEEYDLGVHYDKAKAMAEEARYEDPFVCFDHTEHGAIMSAARELGLVPQRRSSWSI